MAEKEVKYCPLLSGNGHISICQEELCMFWRDVRHPLGSKEVYDCVLAFGLRSLIRLSDYHIFHLEK